MYRKFNKKVVLGLLAHVTASIFFSIMLKNDSFSLQLIFFSEQLLYGNYSTLDSHTNTIISHAFAYSSRWCQKPWQGLFDGLQWFSKPKFLLWQPQSLWGKCSPSTCWGRSLNRALSSYTISSFYWWLTDLRTIVHFLVFPACWFKVKNNQVRKILACHR